LTFEHGGAEGAAGCDAVAALVYKLMKQSLAAIAHRIVGAYHDSTGPSAVAVHAFRQVGALLDQQTTSANLGQ
jgi:hypothetical protein